MTVAATAAAILLGLIIALLEQTRVASETLPILANILMGLAVAAAGLRIWSIGLLARRDHDAYVASLACFLGLMGIRAHSLSPPPSIFLAFLQFALGIILELVQIRILLTAIKRFEGGLKAGNA